MIIRRDLYLKKLLERKHNRLVKIVTGLRRCGKSFLLNTLLVAELKNTGVADDHIICLSLEGLMNSQYRDPEFTYQHIASLMKDSSMYYIIIDEIQMMDRFVEFLNSLILIPNADVYVTGSNSRFLSTDVVTEFRGRGDEIHVFPLSFAEFAPACGLPPDQALEEYMRYGGLPYLVSCKTDDQKENYLKRLVLEVYLKDLVERNRLQHPTEMDELLQLYASSVGSLSSFRKLSATFQSVKGVSLSVNTIGAYSKHLEDAFLIGRAVRYDIKRRRYIDSPLKYYFEDLGIRNACLNFRQQETNHLMENLIYNELRMWGFSVDVGSITVNGSGRNGVPSRQNLEVDFVANSGHRRYYIQSAFMIPDDEKREQETRPLRKISDSFRKIIVMYGNQRPYHNDDGFLIVSLQDFLKGPEVMDL